MKNTGSPNNPKPPRPRRPARSFLASPRFAALGLAAIVVVLALSSVVYVMNHNGRVYQGVSVAGIDLSGLTRDEARLKVAATLEPRLDTPLLLRCGDAEETGSLRQIGMDLDFDKAVDASLAVGRSGSWPEQVGEVANALLRGRDIPPDSFTDRGALHAGLSDLAGRVNIQPVDGVVSISAGVVSTQAPQPGRYLDIEQSAPFLTEYVTEPPSETIVLPMIDNVRPEIDTPQVEAAAARARLLLSSPLVLSHGDQRWEFAPDTVGDLITIEKVVTDSEAHLRVGVDNAGLTALVSDVAKEIDRPTVEAEWAFNGEAVVVTTPSQIGLQTDVEGSVATALSCLETEGQHTADLVVREMPPSLLTDDIDGWGIKQLVASAETDYFSSPERMQNIEVAARKLDGTIIGRGETFSLNSALGDITVANGYDVAYVIVNGETVPGMGGGLCQVATTLFHATFWGGYRIVERYPHEYHMPRYESTKNGVTYKGLDATIAEGVDFVFQNNGPSHLLLKTATDGQNFYVRLYGTDPGWEVAVADYAISNLRPSSHRPITRQSAELPAGKTVQVEKATDGFDSIIARVVTAEGTPVDHYTVASSFRATDDITLVGIGAAPPASTGR